MSSAGDTTSRRAWSRPAGGGWGEGSGAVAMDGAVVLSGHNMKLCMAQAGGRGVGRGRGWGGHGWRGGARAAQRHAVHGAAHRAGALTCCRGAMAGCTPAWLTLGMLGLWECSLSLCAASPSALDQRQSHLAACVRRMTGGRPAYVWLLNGVESRPCVCRAAARSAQRTWLSRR